MTRRPTAIVKRCSLLNDSTWMLVLKVDGQPLVDHIKSLHDHPEGTRLTLVDGEWRKL